MNLFSSNSWDVEAMALEAKYVRIHLSLLCALYLHIFRCFCLQQNFLEMYVKAVLNAREKPPKGLSDAFVPLFSRLTHEDFKNTVIPSSVKMLKRNPELVLESVGILLQSAKLDLSKYAVEILSVLLSQVRHADEDRRIAAVSIVRCLSIKSSSPDAIEAMFNAVKLVIGGCVSNFIFSF